MKCHFYLQREGAPAIKRGPIDAVDDAHARRLALAEFERQPDVNSVDVWCDQGELYRVGRPAKPTASGVGAAWISAFNGRDAQGTRS